MRLEPCPPPSSEHFSDLKLTAVRGPRVLASMHREAITSPQFSYDPWLLAARNASLLGFTYSGAKNRLAKDILRIALYHRPSTANFYRQIRYGKEFAKRMVEDMVRVWRTS